MNGPAVHQLGTPHWANFVSMRFWARAAGAGLLCSFAVWIVLPMAMVPAFFAAAAAVGYVQLTRMVLVCPFCRSRTHVGAAVCHHCGAQVTTP